MAPRSNIAALVLIGIGVLFLLSNFGVVPHFGALLAKWWPAILIVVGVGLLFRRR
ncbi:MAG: hypothetical protein HZC37_18525 [Burkholderiales bacterium]|nr:hypothetical protein [Burkholderiales bacterium]